MIQISICYSGFPCSSIANDYLFSKYTVLQVSSTHRVICADLAPLDQGPTSSTARNLLLLSLYSKFFLHCTWTKCQEDEQEAEGEIPVISQQKCHEEKRTWRLRTLVPKSCANSSRGAADDKMQERIHQSVQHAALVPNKPVFRIFWSSMNM